MRILIAFLCLILVGCEVKSQPDCPDGRCPIDYQQPVDNVPPPVKGDVSVEIPYELRERNYSGGSCVHASTEMVLRMQGHFELADWWRQQYHGGEYASGLESKLERANLRWASTNSGDPEFLQWCSDTRRPATIFYKPAHAILFVSYENRSGQEVAKLLDNNRIEAYEYVPKQRFIRAWQGYGGFAATIVGTPAAPPVWR